MLLVRPTARQRRQWGQRRVHGSQVTFNGQTYWVFTAQTPGNTAGTQALDQAKFGVMLANAAPRLFDFSPIDFMPYTTVDPPVDGSVIQYVAWNYLITHPDVSNVGLNTEGLVMYGYRWIDQPVEGA